MTRGEFMTVFTIGYEGTSISAFISTLVASGVEVLIDVRAVALSRKPGFSKSALATHLERAGIEYLHLVELGDPPQGRSAAREGDYTAFRRIYSRHLSKRKSLDALERVNVIARQRAICLMCFERNPATCHRSLIAGRLAGRGVTVGDLICEDATRDDGVFRSGRNVGEGATAA